MKRRISAILMIMMLALSTMLTGCGSNGETTGGDTGNKYEYNVGASATSGALYRWVVPMTELVNKYSDVVRLNPITTTGTTENVNLMVSGEAPIGTASASTCYNAVNGLVDWDGKPVTGLNFVYSLFPDYFVVFLPANSDVNTLDDLKKKTISIGEVGSGGYTNNVAALTAMGYSLDEFKLENISLADSVSAIAEGWLDGIIYYGAKRTSAMTEMQASPTGLKMIELTEEQVRTACANNPMYKPQTLTDSYPGIPPLRTFGGSFGLYCREDVPEEVIYEIVRVLEEHHDEMVEVFDFAEDSTLENTVDSIDFMDTHPGTLKYMREVGLIK